MRKIEVTESELEMIADALYDNARALEHAASLVHPFTTGAQRRKMTDAGLANIQLRSSLFGRLKSIEKGVD